MKVNLLLPEKWNEKNVFKGLTPAIKLIESSLVDLGHEVNETNRVNANRLNLVFWQSVTNGHIEDVHLLNNQNSAWLQVENIDGFKQWSYQMMHDLFKQTDKETWLKGYSKEYECSQFCRWSENQNVWDYSSLNSKHFKGLPKSYHVFDWAYHKDLDKKVFDDKAKRGIAFYGAYSERRLEFGRQLNDMVDIELISQKWGDDLDEVLKDFSVILSLGSSGKNYFKAIEFKRILESLRVAESVHKGFPVLVEESDDPQQNEYWSQFAVVKPLLHIPHTAIKMLSDDNYKHLAEEKYTAFKEKTSMTRTLERLLDETF